MIELLDDLAVLEERGDMFCMAVMIHSSGSTPRSAGSRMLVLRDGAIRGTVGGGKMEAQVIAAAGDVMKSGQARILDFEFSGADAASLDMICGGSARILLEPVLSHANSLWDVVHALKFRGARGWMITEIQPAGAVAHRFADQIPASLLPDEILNAPGDASRRPFLAIENEQLVFVDPLVPPSRVIVFGAGHVSRSLAAISHIAGFNVTVIDDRIDFANRERFPDSDQVLVVDPITAYFDQQKVTRSDMIVIVTRGHLQDQEVLDAGYIGMIGSRRKRELIYRSMREKGVGEDQISRISSPIGLAIGAETPEEIAVSITAELIQKRAAMRAG
ncbi:MAG TPA: XdhC family protein [Anaerolinea sp.]|nr:XdhC family protein [Anaerolinea sp.]